MIKTLKKRQVTSIIIQDILSYLTVDLNQVHRLF